LRCFVVVTHVHVTGVCGVYGEVNCSSYQANIAFLYLSYTHYWSRRGRDRMVVETSQVLRFPDTYP
jgi:hypothetical protein